MVETTILHSQEPQLNACLLITLFSPIIFQDFELQKDGLYCYFTQSITHFQVIIKTFLDALYEITNIQFYFEIIKDQEAILKIYRKEPLEFFQNLLFKSSIPSQGRSEQ